MLAKLTAKNQLTIPETVLADCKEATYFDVTSENGRIVLTPVRINPADAVRAKLAEQGIAEQDATDALSWMRGSKQPAQ